MGNGLEKRKAVRAGRREGVASVWSEKINWREVFGQGVRKKGRVFVVPAGPPAPPHAGTKKKGKKKRCVAARK